MTAPDWPLASDAELVAGAAAGERAAFAGIYDRYADRLHDFCIGMLRDRDAAADCVQDAFCIAATRLGDLRDADKLRPWLYAIARNEALRCIRARNREQPSEQVPEITSDDPGPEVMAARSELADLIVQAAGGLSDRDRAVLELYYRHGLDGPELADALGVSHDSAKKMAQRLREGIERSLGALLVSRRWQSAAHSCGELATILDGWDGQFTVLMRKRVARHIESCPVCDEERSRLVNPVALLGAAPVFIPAPAWLRERTLNQVQLPPPGESTGAGGRRNGLSRRVLLAGALVVAVVIAAIGIRIAWLDEHSSSVMPANKTGTTTPQTQVPGGGQPDVRGTSTSSVATVTAGVQGPTTTPKGTPTPTTTNSPAPPPESTPPPEGGATTAPATLPSAPPVFPVRPTVPTATSPAAPPIKPTGIPPVSPVRPTHPVVGTLPTVAKLPPTSTPPVIQ
jgi:RNA polymerase sigma factor (sigma-70 family)